MIAQTFDEVFSPQWINTHLSHPTHDLIILRQLIPWQSIMDGLVPFYASNRVVPAVPYAPWSPSPSWLDCASSAIDR
jgi:hypothetical protein